MTAIELRVFCAMIAMGVLLARALYPHGVTPAVLGFFGRPCPHSLHDQAYFKYRRWLYVGDKDMPDCGPMKQARQAVEKSQSLSGEVPKRAIWEVVRGDWALIWCVRI